MLLTLEADELNNLHWWIDNMFVNHIDIHSHTGGPLRLGKGVVYGMSTWQS